MQNFSEFQRELYLLKVKPIRTKNAVF